MAALALLAPIFLVIEIIQIVILERYVGLRTIRADLDPRDLPFPLWLAVLWILVTKLYLVWTVILVFESGLRLPAFVILAVTLAGLMARRSASIKWTLVILTFETAIRVGMLMVVARWGWERLA